MTEEEIAKAEGMADRLEAEARLIRRLLAEVSRDPTDPGEIDWRAFNVRVRKAIRRLDVKTWGDLAALTPWQLLKQRNFGMSSLCEVRERLRGRGLRLTHDYQEDYRLAVKEAK